MSAGECFNQIRANYMDSLARDALVRGFPLSHPVIWLDADSPYMSRAAIPDLIDAIVSGTAFFYHLNDQLTGDDPNALPFSQRTIEERTAAIYALTERMIHRKTRLRNIHGYMDESGTGFQLGNYLRYGGVGQVNNTIGESRILRLRTKRWSLKEPRIEYLMAARLGISYRRLPLLLQQFSPAELAWHRTAEDYDDYVSLAAKNEPKAKSDTTISAVTIREMIDTLDRCSSPGIITAGKAWSPVLSTAQRRQLDLVIKRFGFE
jgi:hypothetical protein